MRRLAKASKKTAFIILKTIQIFLVLLVIVCGFAFWKLSVSPMNVDDWVPEIANRLLPADTQLVLKTKGAFLKTGFNKNGIFQITIDELTLSQKDGTVLTRLPAVHMVYSLRKLLTLDYIPNTLVIQKPTVQFVIDPQGRWMFQSNHKQGAKTDAEIQADLARSAEPSSFNVSKESVRRVVNYFLSFNRIEIQEGEILLDDQQNHKKLSMPELNLSLERTQKGLFTLDLKSVIHAQDISANLGMKAVLDKAKRIMPFDIYFDSVDVASFSEVMPMLADIKLVVKGNVSGQLDLKENQEKWQDVISQLSFKVQNQGTGSVSLPAPLTNLYPVQSFLIQGGFDADFKSISIADSKIILTSGPVADVSMDVTGIDAFLNSGDLNQVQTTLNARVQQALIEQVPDVWPSALGPDAHAWVKENLSQGQVDLALFTLYFKGAELVDLKGDIDVSGVRVDYLNPMPAVENVSGKVYLYPDKVEIFADQGHVQNIQLKKADLYLTDLNNTGLADIRIQAEGPVAEAMALIDSEPLGFAKMFQLDPAQTGGTGAVNLTLNFPFDENLQMNDVQTRVLAKITDGVFSLPFKGAQITQGDFDLTVTNQALKLSGTANWGAHPLTLHWDEFFEPLVDGKEKIKTKYTVSGVIADDVLTPFYADIADYVKGDIGLNVSLQENTQEKMTVDVQADLKNALVQIYPISLTKQPGAPMNVDVDFGLLNESLIYPLIFNATGSQGMQIQGELDLSDGILLDLKTVQSHENDFKGRFIQKANGNVSLTLSGKRLNMKQLAQMPLFKKAEAEEGKVNIPNAQATPPDILLDIQLDAFYMTADKPLTNVMIQGKRQGYYWQNLSAHADGVQPFDLTFTPQTRTLKAQTGDMGDLIMRLGGTGRLTGGHLYILATQPNSGGFKGEVSVKNFDLKDIGFFTQALTILGIVDAVRGKEMNFKKAVIPFELTPYHTLFINEGYANGTSVGVTFGGRISFDHVQLDGSVIPAYAINSLPGKIPFIGRLFKDGAGGGLMGLRYEVTGTPGQSKTDFKPLSSLAPGILGKLFN